MIGSDPAFQTISTLTNVNPALAHSATSFCDGEPVCSAQPAVRMHK